MRMPTTWSRARPTWCSRSAGAWWSCRARRRSILRTCATWWRSPRWARSCSRPCPRSTPRQGPSTISSRTPWAACSISSACACPGSRAGRVSKELPQSAIERLGLLDVGDVRCIGDADELRPRDVLADVLRARRRAVLLTGDREHRQADVLQARGGIELHDRLAAADVAGGGCAGDQCRDAL